MTFLFLEVEGLGAGTGAGLDVEDVGAGACSCAGFEVEVLGAGTFAGFDLIDFLAGFTFSAGFFAAVFFTAGFAFATGFFAIVFGALGAGASTWVAGGGWFDAGPGPSFLGGSVTLHFPFGASVACRRPSCLLLTDLIPRTSTSKTHRNSKYPTRHGISPFFAFLLVFFWDHAFFFTPIGILITSFSVRHKLSIGIRYQ